MNDTSHTADAAPAEPTTSVAPLLPWRRTTWWPALVGSLLLWASFPPLGRWLWPLAWIAPLLWIDLVRMPRLPGRWRYRALWLASAVHWLALMQGMRLAHWGTYFGWLALALYLACYLPLFIGLSRAAVHRLRVPTVLAVPLVWTGLEYARGYMLTGFSMALLAHTQVRWTALIQVSDLAGAYAVSFLMMLTAGCLASCLPQEGRPGRWWPALPGVAAVAVALIYGHRQLDEAPPERRSEPIGNVALVQGSVYTLFGADSQQLATHIFAHYRTLSEAAVLDAPEVDLLIWPESMFTQMRFTFEGAIEPPHNWRSTAGDFGEKVQVGAELFHRAAAFAVEYDVDGDHAPDRSVPMLVGAEALHAGPFPPRRYNVALLLGDDGALSTRYDKMHPVMFGEYVPLGDRFPWIYRLVPFRDGLTRGAGPVLCEVGSLRICPSICFENTVPHLIRRQVVELNRQGQPPNLLVTVTNDGWFWGSSILELHLACGVFRAVETRLPVLIAANTGISASIDAEGRIRSEGPTCRPEIADPLDGIVAPRWRARVRPHSDPRKQAGYAVVDVMPGRGESGYLTWGDWPAAACLAFCGVVAVLAVLRRSVQAERRE